MVNHYLIIGICIFSLIYCVQSFRSTSFKVFLSSPYHPSNVQPSIRGDTALFSNGPGKRYAEVLQFLRSTPPRPIQQPLPDNPEDMAIIESIVKAADDRKAIDVVVFDVRGVSDTADYFIIMEGNSKPQNQAIVSSIEVVNSLRA